MFINNLLEIRGSSFTFHLLVLILCRQSFLYDKIQRNELQQFLLDFFLPNFTMCAICFIYSSMNFLVYFLTEKLLPCTVLWTEFYWPPLEFFLLFHSLAGLCADFQTLEDCAKVSSSQWKTGKNIYIQVTVNRCCCFFKYWQFPIGLENFNTVIRLCPTNPKS